nr:immunoglobulin heavy chain junction region [Macaca mulatta]
CALGPLTNFDYW